MIGRVYNRRYLYFILIFYILFVRQNAFNPARMLISAICKICARARENELTSRFKRFKSTNNALKLVYTTI